VIVADELLKGGERSLEAVELDMLCPEAQEAKGAMAKQVSGSSAPDADKVAIGPVRHTWADVEVQTWFTWQSGTSGLLGGFAEADC